MRMIATALSVFAVAALTMPATADAHPHRWHRPHKVCKVVRYPHHTKRVCRWVR